MTDQQAERSSRIVTTGSSLVYFVFACLAVLHVLAMPVFQYFSVAGNAEYACIMGPVPPDAAVQGEVSLVEGHKTAFPAGRYCELESISGEPLTYQTGWVITMIACVATLIVAWVTVLAIRRRRPRNILVALVPAALTLLAWVAVFV
ncbi:MULTISPECIES: hypothetical protein [unclassified Microbacterium]|uniref:hypothetical protein n=1 Tax=unclassified Microbacterium TaxID=2609290 RepID=UPI000EA9D173|nr:MULTISPECIES: hypothetical protein [unclassified Microbacterium]MBT2486440.1 hypothetical protein [Microbacterium sp. ISL-108]RKN69140.1 hypothetical protein D7252_17210 [Microbacterium sp. CGR2]